MGVCVLVGIMFIFIGLFVVLPCCQGASSGVSLAEEGSGIIGDLKCPNGWKRNGNHCYYYDESYHYIGFTWQSAADKCRKQHIDSFLPKITTKSENDFILGLGVHQPFWIGASREFQEPYRENKSWSWEDGETIGYADWDWETVPDNYWYNERCVRDYNNRWDDRQCSWMNA